MVERSEENQRVNSESKEEIDNEEDNIGDYVCCSRSVCGSV